MMYNRIALLFIKRVVIDIHSKGRLKFTFKPVQTKDHIKQVMGDLFFNQFQGHVCLQPVAGVNQVGVGKFDILKKG